MKLQKYMTIYDKILIFLLILLSSAAIISPALHHWNLDDEEQKNYIMIQSGNEIVTRIDLEKTFRDKPLFLEIEGPLGLSIIEAHKGRVRMYKAPDKDPLKICEKTGWISGEGPRIICVPNKITVWIETGVNGVDGVTE